MVLKNTSEGDFVRERFGTFDSEVLLETQISTYCWELC